MKGVRGAPRRGGPCARARARVGDPEVLTAPRASHWSQDAALGGPRLEGALSPRAIPSTRHMAGRMRLASQERAREGVGAVGGRQESQRKGRRDRQPWRARETDTAQRTGENRTEKRDRETEMRAQRAGDREKRGEPASHREGK